MLRTISEICFAKNNLLLSKNKSKLCKYKRTLCKFNHKLCKYDPSLVFIYFIFLTFYRANIRVLCANITINCANMIQVEFRVALFSVSALFSHVSTFFRVAQAWITISQRIEEAHDKWIISRSDDVEQFHQAWITISQIWSKSSFKSRATLKTEPCNS